MKGAQPGNPGCTSRSAEYSYTLLTLVIGSTLPTGNHHWSHGMSSPT